MATLRTRLLIEWNYLESGGSAARAAARAEGISAQACRSHIYALRQAQGLSGENSTPVELDIQRCLRLSREGKNTYEIGYALSWPVDIVETCLERWAGIGVQSEEKRLAVERKFAPAVGVAPETLMMSTVADILKSKGILAGFDIIPGPLLDEVDDETRAAVEGRDRRAGQ